MMSKLALGGAAVQLSLSGAALAQGAGKMNDAQIAHVAYTAGQIDIAAGRQALARSKNKMVRQFAQEMVRDHTAVNGKALSLVKRLHVTPQPNSTSASLSKGAAAKLRQLGRLKGAAFDRAYLQNEVAYHRTVNGALKDTLIPGSSNGDLKSLLQTGLTLFTEHQTHAEHLLASFR